jgi:hypothetical protein
VDRAGSVTIVDPDVIGELHWESYCEYLRWVDIESRPDYPEEHRHDLDPFTYENPLILLHDEAARLGNFSSPTKPEGKPFCMSPWLDDLIVQVAFKLVYGEKVDFAQEVEDYNERLIHLRWSTK